MSRLRLTSFWRVIWYSVLIWLSANIFGGFIFLPWYYLILPIVIFWTTVYYFRSSERTLSGGLRVSLFWFFAIFALNFLEFLGPYYANARYYFSDFRNWFLYPLVLLVPVIYCLCAERKRFG
ncbi:hypothetical protein A2165_00715 [Candidatus Curtissbacteria bacterium RBG_13_40_7]|uniref:Uncharacterized protein n=1 Tax=Candidatus Curtissbacteria bacterium RBG_13_40_7 TaxID=1797706 RepID=A0A1F5FUF6_9BACT|nr:MAG: hypothetical protein A2165_00715 [Candidatus Curtissbacteria bacterium RBG_13_40_7]